MFADAAAMLDADLPLRVEARFDAAPRSFVLYFSFHFDAFILRYCR